MNPRSPLYRAIKRLVWYFWRPYWLVVAWTSKDFIVWTKYGNTNCELCPSKQYAHKWAFENLRIDGSLIEEERT